MAPGYNGVGPYKIPVPVLQIKKAWDRFINLGTSNTFFIF